MWEVGFVREPRGMGWESGVRNQQWLIHEGVNLEKLQPGEALCYVAAGVLQQTCFSAVAEQTVPQQTCLYAVAASLDASSGVPLLS